MLAGCGETNSSEDAFRQTLTKMEQSIEQRNVDDFMDHINENYSDSQSRDRDDIRRIAMLHVLRNKNLHLFRHTTSMQFVENESAQVVVLVAIAGRPIDSVESLSTLNAELMKFHVDFVFDQEWTAISADWSRASLNDFL